MKKRKSRREKMDNPNLPKIVPISPNLRKRFGDGEMLVPSAGQIEACIRAVRPGNVTTVSSIRAFLAAKFGVQTTCPLARKGAWAPQCPRITAHAAFCGLLEVTGIFIHIAAEAAEEEACAGKRKITPYWRVVKEDGSLNAKFPGGATRQAERLRAEGLPVSTRGRYTLKELPQPQVDFTCGLLNLNPEPSSVST